MRIDGAGGDRSRVTCTASACRGGRSRRAVVRHGGLVQGRSLQGAARPLSPPLWASSIPSVVAVALVGLIAPGRGIPPLGVGAATGPGVLLLAHGPGGAGKALADKLGISTNAVSALRTAETMSKINGDRLDQIAAALTKLSELGGQCEALTCSKTGNQAHEPAAERSLPGEHPCHH